MAAQLLPHSITLSNITDLAIIYKDHSIAAVADTSSYLDQGITSVLGTSSSSQVALQEPSSLVALRSRLFDFWPPSGS